MGQLQATSSNYSGNPSKKGNFPVQSKKNMPRFMTKKEKEAKEALDKKQKAFRERLKRMKELEKEILEMQQLVKDTIKNP
jgi:AAA15 family ATPase/GTPase